MSKNNLKVYVSQQELGLYQNQKVRRDLIFFQKTTPYIRFVLLGSMMIGMGICYYNSQIEERENYFKKLYLNLLDLEENPNSKIGEIEI
jgi:hypothetical protein